MKQLLIVIVTCIIALKVNAHVILPDYVEINDAEKKTEDLDLNTIENRHKRSALALDNGITGVIDRSLCTLPSPDPREVISPVAQVYGPNSHTVVTTYRNDPSAVMDAVLEHNNGRMKRVVFVTHGFTGDISNSWMHAIKDEILWYNRDQVVVLIGWRRGALPCDLENMELIYSKAAANTQVVGEFIGDILNLLKDALDTAGTQFYGIGHSLGSHVMGKAGRYSSAFSRITGLDPAGPCFQTMNLDKRLSSSDATLVDVIHSDGFSDSIVGAPFYYGTLVPLGHLDFYPNWGQRGQPGCWSLSLGCSHEKAIAYFIWSISHPGLFETGQLLSSQPRWNHIDFVLGVVEDVREMGYYADSIGYTASGSVYIETNSEEPYNVSIDSGYFAIVYSGNGKVMKAHNDGQVALADRSPLSNDKQWYKEGQLLRNRNWPDKVVDFHGYNHLNHGWGYVYLTDQVHKGSNQRFVLKEHDHEVICQWEGRGFVLGFRNELSRNPIGCHDVDNDDDAQVWEIDYI